MRICALSIEEPLASGRIPRPAATSEVVEVLQMAIDGLNYSCSTAQSNPIRWQWHCKACLQLQLRTMSEDFGHVVRSRRSGPSWDERLDEPA